MDKLGVSDLKRAHDVRNFHSVILEPGATLEDIQRPGFWAHVARRLHVRDRIEFWADDGTWFCEAVVRMVGNLEAVVSIIPGSLAEFGKKVTAELVLDDYRVRYVGMKRLWGVFRLVDGKDPQTDKPMKVEDGQPVKDGFGTRELAEAWLKDHKKAIAA